MTDQTYHLPPICPKCHALHRGECPTERGQALLAPAGSASDYWSGVDFKKGDGVKINGEWHKVAYADFGSPYIGVECSNMNHPACKHNPVHVHAAKCFIEDYLLQNNED